MLQMCFYKKKLPVPNIQIRGMYFPKFWPLYCKNNDFKNSAIANHSNDYHSNINYNTRTFSINLIEKCTGFLDRKCTEAYHIIISKPDLIRNTGLYLTT